MQLTKTDKPPGQHWRADPGTTASKTHGNI
jgi:hypothetical protein